MLVQHTYNVEYKFALLYICIVRVILLSQKFLEQDDASDNDETNDFDSGSDIKTSRSESKLVVGFSVSMRCATLLCISHIDANLSMLRFFSPRSFRHTHNSIIW